MGVVGRELSGAGLVGVVLGATAATWIVLIFVAVLVMIGIALIITALWVLQNTEGDPDALRPLEVMGSRRFRSADQDARRQQLEEARPDGAGSPPPMVAADGFAGVSRRSSGPTKSGSTKSGSTKPGSSESSSSDTDSNRSDSTSSDKTTATRRVRRYRAGDRPTKNESDAGADEAGDDDAVGTGTTEKAVDSAAASEPAGDEVGEDWWLDLDEEDQPARDDQLDDEDRLDDVDHDQPSPRASAGRARQQEQSYLDVLADWESDPEDDADWEDEPAWTASRSKRVAARDLDEFAAADDDDGDEFDDIYDDYEVDDYEVDDPVVGPGAVGDLDTAIGIVPAQRRRSGRRGSSDRGNRPRRSRSRNEAVDVFGDILDADYDNYDDEYDDYDDEFDDEYTDDEYTDDRDDLILDDDNEDDDMDFDDNDYDGFAAASPTPTGDPFFDDDFDGSWDTAAEPKRPERPARRPRSGAAGGGRARRRVPSAGMNSFDPEAMVDRFRQRAAAVRRRPLPPVAGEERQEFIRQAKIDYQDFAMIGDAEVTVEDGVLVLRLDLRAD